MFSAEMMNEQSNLLQLKKYDIVRFLFLSMLLFLLDDNAAVNTENAKQLALNRLFIH